MSQLSLAVKRYAQVYTVQAKRWKVKRVPLSLQEHRWGAYMSSWVILPRDVYTAESLMHGQSDVTPTVTSQPWHTVTTPW